MYFCRRPRRFLISHFYELSSLLSSQPSRAVPNHHPPPEISLLFALNSLSLVLTRHEVRFWRKKFTARSERNHYTLMLGWQSRHFSSRCLASSRSHVASFAAWQAGWLAGLPGETGGKVGRQSGEARRERVWKPSFAQGCQSAPAERWETDER